MSRTYFLLPEDIRTLKFFKEGPWAEEEELDPEIEFQDYEWEAYARRYLIQEEQRRQVAEARKLQREQRRQEWRDWEYKAREEARKYSGEFNSMFWVLFNKSNKQRIPTREKISKEVARQRRLRRQRA